LEHLSNMTRDQKEQYVLELYQQGKTIRQIAQLTHMSFRDIGTITKKHKKEIELGNEPTQHQTHHRSKSKVTQAFKMLAEGYSPPQVVIELDIPPEDVQRIYRQYLETRGMYDFLQVCEQIRQSGRYSISSFLKLHTVLYDLGITEQQIKNVLDLANNNKLEYLQWLVELLTNDVNRLEEEKVKCTNHLTILNRKRDQYMREEYTLASHIAELREEMSMVENISRSLRPNHKLGQLPYYRDDQYRMSSTRALTYREDRITPMNNSEVGVVEEPIYRVDDPKYP
jgi:hypothetical protein